MKKSKLIILPMVAAAVTALVGCTAPSASDTAPVIEGTGTLDWLEKQPLDLLDRVRAIDAENGDITPLLNISIDGATVNDGVVTFDTPGEYRIDFSVTDGAGNRTEDSLAVNVRAREIAKTFVAEDFGGKFDEAQGAKGEMRVESGKIIYHAQKFSSTDWANELSSSPFSIEDNAKSYVISFTAKSNNPVETVFTIPTFGAWDPTLIWRRMTIEAQEKEYRFLLGGVPASGPYYILFQFGAAANTGLGDTTIELSNINLEVKSDVETFN